MGLTVNVNSCDPPFEFYSQRYPIKKELAFLFEIWLFLMLVLYIIYMTSGLLLTKAIISKSIVLEVILNDKNEEKKTFKKTNKLLF